MEMSTKQLVKVCSWGVVIWVAFYAINFLPNVQQYNNRVCQTEVCK